MGDTDTASLWGSQIRELFGSKSPDPQLVGSLVQEILEGFQSRRSQDDRARRRNRGGIEDGGNLLLPLVILIAFLTLFRSR